MLVHFVYAQYQPLFAYFCLFHNAMTNRVYNFDFKVKKLGWCDWDSNPGAQDETMVGADKSAELLRPPREPIISL